MISFECDNCGRTVNAGDDKAGMSGKCRWCGHVIVVPSPEEIEAAAEAARIAAEAVKIPDDALEAPEFYYPDKPMASIAAEQEPSPQRVLPMPFDMLLYPTNKAGLLTLAVIVGTPLVLGVIMRLIGMFSCFLFVPYLLLLTVIWCYGFWYMSECIRDSAEGGIRAPETIGNAPDLGEIMLRWLSIMLTALCCIAPMVIYVLNSKRTDGVFWALFGGAVFVFPMALLSVVMQDSLSGLSPLVLIPAMVRTLPPYCALVCIYATIGFLITRIAMPSSLPPFAEYPIYAVVMYMSLVAGHVLGAFYHRYEKRLW